ncbi:MAG: ribosome silencing factor [Bifidobacteriaceae bacterium]|jgi:ribosome-associated protein|nr:ribosome silencing factor [Bifidobacteriaceae bacterium]
MVAATPESIRDLKIAAQAANEEKARDIVAIDVSEPLAITDAFLLATGTNPRQVIAISEEIEKQLYLQSQVKPRMREGLEEAQWVLLDYGDYVIHVMDEKARDFYGLERLWADCPTIELDLEHVEGEEGGADDLTSATGDSKDEKKETVGE